MSSGDFNVQPQLRISGIDYVCYIISRGFVKYFQEATPQGILAAFSL